MFLSSTSILDIKIGGKLYPIESLINKTVYASKDTLLFKNGYGEAPTKVNKGGVLGKVFSWINLNGQIYLMFNINKGSNLLKYYPAGSYYVKAADIDENTLKQQGTKTTEQETKEAENKNKTTTDKIIEKVFYLGLGVAAIFALGGVAKQAISK